MDCGGTFAPVCRLQPVRMVLAINAEKNWEVLQLETMTEEMLRLRGDETAAKPLRSPTESSELVWDNG